MKRVIGGMIPLILKFAENIYRNYPIMSSIYENFTRKNNNRGKNKESKDFPQSSNSLKYLSILSNYMYSAIV